MSGFLSVLVSYGATAVKAAYQKIIASDTASQTGANFGSAVALSGNGNYIVVGSALAGSADDGAVYVYYNNSGTWEEQAKLVASNAVVGDWFGCAVDITKTGDRIIVGAQKANALPYNQDNSGAAYIFQRSGTTWTEELYLPGGNGGSNDYCGNSVAINDNGTAIFVGAYGDEGDGTNVGFVHTFLIKGNTWAGLKWNTDDDMLPTSATESNSHHGWSVACNANGERCIEGGPGDNNQGKTNSGVVTIHRRASLTGAWTRDIWLEPPYPSNDGQFGWSVAMDAIGDRVVIGAIGESPTGIISAGAAYIYKRTGTVWALEAQLTADAKEAGDKFGYSVSINAAGDKVTVGTIYANIPTKAAAGVVYVFERSSSIWTQSSKLTAGDAEAGDNLGSAVSLDDAGTGVVVGSLGNDPFGSIDSGAAYYFPLTVTPPYVPVDPYWNDVVLLITADNGAQGSKIFVDLSKNNIGLTSHLAVVTDTSIKKFGSGSIAFPTAGYLITPTTSILDFTDALMTIEAWVYPTSFAAPHSCIVMNPSAASGKGWELQVEDNSRLTFQYNFAVSGSVLTGDPLNLNEWNHVAVTYDGSTIRLYSNGVLGNSITTTLRMGTGGIRIGWHASTGGGDADYRGFMDEVRITKGVARYTGATYTIPTNSFYS
jgi:hypothetical protein